MDVQGLGNHALNRWSAKVNRVGLFAAATHAKVPGMTRTTSRTATFACITLAAAISACSSSDTTASTGSPGASMEEARKELRDVGLDKYIGKAKPGAPETRGDIKVYTFDPADGPKCLRGGAYEVFVREGTSDNLVIYLEGGGACWTGFCYGNETAENTLNNGTINPAGILSKDPAVSPVADWNLVYLTYCDGSTFAGDNEFPNDTPPRFHHGIQNLTAGIDLAKSLYPNPKRIFLAGSSAGGYGTLSATGVVRLEYEQNELMVFDDSGVVTTNPNDPSISEKQQADWKFEQFIPKSCTDCFTDQLTDIIAWSLEHDPTLRFSAFSSFGDSVIAGFFFQIPAADFKALLLSVTGKIHAAYPDRFERFLIPGTQHTTLLTLGTSAGGTTSGDFVRGMVEKTAAWKDTVVDGDGGM